jgi:hypothetical protein
MLPMGSRAPNARLGIRWLSLFVLAACDPAGQQTAQDSLSPLDPKSKNYDPAALLAQLRATQPDREAAEAIERKRLDDVFRRMEVEEMQRFMRAVAENLKSDAEMTAEVLKRGVSLGIDDSEVEANFAAMGVVLFELAMRGENEKVGPRAGLRQMAEKLPSYRQQQSQLFEEYLKQNRWLERVKAADGSTSPK